MSSTSVVTYDNESRNELRIRSELQRIDEALASESLHISPIDLIEPPCL